MKPHEEDGVVHQTDRGNVSGSTLRRRRNENGKGCCEKWKPGWWCATENLEARATVFFSVWSSQTG